MFQYTISQWVLFSFSTALWDGFGNPVMFQCEKAVGKPGISPRPFPAHLRNRRHLRFAVYYGRAGQSDSDLCLWHDRSNHTGVFYRSGNGETVPRPLLGLQ